MAEKMALLAPIPRASVRTMATESPRRRRTRVLIVERHSWAMGGPPLHLETPGPIEWLSRRIRRGGQARDRRQGRRVLPVTPEELHRGLAGQGHRDRRLQLALVHPAAALAGQAVASEHGDALQVRA